MLTIVGRILVLARCGGSNSSDTSEMSDDIGER